MPSSFSEATRQAEFLNKLSALMEEYGAVIYVDESGESPLIGIDACGAWIHGVEFGSMFNVDDCIEATQGAIEFAKAVEP